MLRRGVLRDRVRPYVKKFQAVANVHRLSIVHCLAHLPMSAGDIVDAVGLPDNLVSHHLRILETGGWVKKIKKGRTVTYRLRERIWSDLFYFVSDTPFFRKFQPPKVR